MKAEVAAVLWFLIALSGLCFTFGYQVRDSYLLYEIVEQYSFYVAVRVDEIVEIFMWVFLVCFSVGLVWMVGINKELQE